MKRAVLNSFLALVLLWLSGCSVSPIQTVIANSRNLENSSRTFLIDANGQAGSEKSAEGNWSRIGKATNLGTNCRVKYHHSYAKNLWMAVEGELSNGTKYPVVLDTGASTALFVNDIHILENNLAIRPFKTDSGDLTGWGACHLPKLTIGEITLVDWPCYYRNQHVELRVFGLTVLKDKALIAGLVALREFKYIVFDSLRREAEFSIEKAFEPTKPDLWTKYPFVIEEDFSGNAFLFVKIPIAGQLIELQLDTGSGRGLAIGEKLWQRIRRKIKGTSLKKGKDLYPYIGWLDCRKTVIAQLSVGDRKIENAKISIFPNESPLLDQCEGLLGMQYFQDTVIVLDFERNLLWVSSKADA